jgi:hypothetical protein
MTESQKAAAIVTVLVVSAVGLAVWLMLHRRATRLAASRWRERPPMSDRAFLIACEIPDELVPIEVALAARRVIAELGTVPSETILAHDTFAYDLIQLPFWDSLDWLDFIFRVERECQIKLSRPIFCESAIKWIPRRDRDLQVRHVIRAVVLAVTAPKKTLLDDEL